MYWKQMVSRVFEDLRKSKAPADMVPSSVFSSFVSVGFFTVADLGTLIDSPMARISGANNNILPPTFGLANLTFLFAAHDLS
jgi:hypothetical protein